MKIVVSLLSLVLVGSVLAQESAQEIEAEAFMTHLSALDLEACSATGDICSMEDEAFVKKLMILTDKYLPHAKFYRLDTGKSDVVRSKLALGISTFFRVRDFDPIRVSAIPSSKLNSNEGAVLDKAISDLSGFEEKVLTIMKKRSDPISTKVIEGPDAGKWSSSKKVGVETVCYQERPCAFYDVSKNLRQADEYIYIVFYEGDETRANLRGVIRLPSVQLVAGKRLLYLQTNPRNEDVDFAVVFEVKPTI